MMLKKISGLIIVVFLFITSIGFSGCITDEGSKDKDSPNGSESVTIYMPPEGKIQQTETNGSGYINFVKFNEYDVYGNIISSYMPFARSCGYGERYSYRQVSNVTLDPYYKDSGTSQFPTDDKQHYRPFHRIDKFEINNPGDNPISNQIGLDFYPPEIRTSYKYTTSILGNPYFTNINASTSISIINYGKGSDVTVKLRVEHLDRGLYENDTIILSTTGHGVSIINLDDPSSNNTFNFKITEYQIVFHMEKMEEVHVSAFFPSYIKRCIINGTFIDRKTTDLWEVRYAPEEDISYGNMKVIRES